MKPTPRDTFPTPFHREEEKHTMGKIEMGLDENGRLRDASKGGLYLTEKVAP